MKHEDCFWDHLERPQAKAKFRLARILHNCYRLDYAWVVKRTAMALLVQDFEGNEVWIPKKCILDAEEYGIEGGVLTISEWLAREKGYID